MATETPKNESKAFVAIYGQKALDGAGFTMLPNDLLDNLGDLKLSHADKLVLIQILRLKSYGASARKIGKRAGVSRSQVLVSNTKLAKMGLITKGIKEPGGVNHFTTGGIVKLVMEYAEKRHGGMIGQDNGIVHTEQGSIQNDGTIKEGKEMKEEADGKGYAKALAAVAKLKKKKRP